MSTLLKTVRIDMITPQLAAKVLGCLNTLPVKQLAAGTYEDVDHNFCATAACVREKHTPDVYWSDLINAEFSLDDDTLFSLNDGVLTEGAFSSTSKETPAERYTRVYETLTIIASGGTIE